MARMYRGGMAILCLVAALVAGLPAAIAAAPIRIGFSMALTGGGASNGKVALIAMNIWKDDINAKGGLLGRPVELVYYDDQTNPANYLGLAGAMVDRVLALRGQARQ